MEKVQALEMPLVVAQPWRGIFGAAVTIGYAFTLSSIFNMDEFNNISLLIMSFIPILIITGMAWKKVSYPATAALPQPWRGLLLTSLVAIIGVLTSYALRNFLAGGASQPFIILYSITVVITTFFLVIAFGLWPFSGLRIGTGGWLTLLLAYVVMWFAFKLFNFDLLSFPTGQNPSPIPPVPFYAKGGPLEAFSNLAPQGPFRWESAISCYLWAVFFLFSFAALQMWPFHKYPKMMRQPVLGISLVIACGVLTAIVYAIGVGSMKIEPLRFMLYGISILYGLLMLMTMFQMWPGRALPPPFAGFVNIAIGIVIGILAYQVYKSFGIWHFGEKAMQYPNNIFAMANMMLGFTFPAWACYSDLWDFWPLPELPQGPPGS